MNREKKKDVKMKHLSSDPVGGKNTQNILRLKCSKSLLRCQPKWTKDTGVGKTLTLEAERSQQLAATALGSSLQASSLFPHLQEGRFLVPLVSVG